MPNLPKTQNKVGGGIRVTPVEIDRVRRSAYDIVRRTLPEVRSVLRSQKEWTNQQVRLFGMLLNKVLPDLHHTYAEHHHEHRNINELSIDELEAIVSAAKSQPKIIEGEPTPPPAEPTPEQFELGPPTSDDPLTRDLDIHPLESDTALRRNAINVRIHKIKENATLIQKRELLPSELSEIALLRASRDEIPHINPVRFHPNKDADND